MKLSNKKLMEMYESLVLIRAFEEKVDELISTGQITGTTHLGIGQEGTMVGAGYALKDTDYISTTHRGHGHTLVKGADVDRMMAELFGKEDGFCKGRSGSLHMVDMSTRNIGSNGIIGGCIPMAAGAALALKMKKKDDVLLCTFGDGALNEGAFHEGMNMASVWDLPVIYLCENNQYGMSTSIAEAFNITDLATRATSYGIPGYNVDGNDVLAVYEVTQKAIEHARAGKGPVLIVADTYRWKGHSKSDARKYRTREEENAWKEKCPIKRFRALLMEKGLLDDKKVEEIEEKIYDRVDQAEEFARKSPYPAEETLTDYIFIEEVK